MSLHELWPLMMRARIETLKRKLTPQQLLNESRDKICQRVAREESLTIHDASHVRRLTLTTEREALAVHFRISFTPTTNCDFVLTLTGYEQPCGGVKSMTPRA